MKIKNTYHKMVFLTLLIFVSACSQDSQHKKDKVLSYSEEDDSPNLSSAATVEVDFHSGPLFLNSIKSAHETLFKADLIDSTFFSITKNRRHKTPTRNASKTAFLYLLYETDPRKYIFYNSTKYT